MVSVLPVQLESPVQPKMLQKLSVFQVPKCQLLTQIKVVQYAHQDRPALLLEFLTLQLVQQSNTPSLALQLVRPALITVYLPAKLIRLEQRKIVHLEPFMILLPNHAKLVPQAMNATMTPR